MLSEYISNFKKNIIEFNITNFVANSYKKT